MFRKAAINIIVLLGIVVTCLQQKIPDQQPQDIYMQPDTEMMFDITPRPLSLAETSDMTWPDLMALTKPNISLRSREVSKICLGREKIVDILSVRLIESDFYHILATTSSNTVSLYKIQNDRIVERMPATQLNALERHLFGVIYSDNQGIIQYRVYFINKSQKVSFDDSSSKLTLDSKLDANKSTDRVRLLKIVSKSLTVVAFSEFSAD